MAPHRKANLRKQLKKRDKSAGKKPSMPAAVEIKSRKDSNSSVVRLSHIPYGFFEKEMRNYFRQFGEVVRVRLLRNKKGHFSGTAFVQFTLPEVAEIAAESMDNYLIADKRMRCKVLRVREVPVCIQSGPLFVKTVKPMEAKIQHVQQQFGEKTKAQEDRQRVRLVRSLKRGMEKIRSLGIDYDFDYSDQLKEFSREAAKAQSCDGDSPELGEEEVELETESEMNIV